MSQEDVPPVDLTRRFDEMGAETAGTGATPDSGAGQAESPPAKQRKSSRQKRSEARTAPARPPFEAVTTLRIAIAAMMTGLWALTIGGGILLLLLWQQDRESGVLTDQLDRTWQLFDALRITERWLAFALVPVSMAWIALAAINARRANGTKRDPFVAALSLPFGVIGVWYTGREIVAVADDWTGEASGYVLQCVFLAVPFLALLRVAQAADSPNSTLRVVYVLAAAYVAQMQFLGGLSTIDQSSQPDEWARLSAFLVIGGLIQVLGALAVNEAARSIETTTANRYLLRSRFGESLLAQAERGAVAD